jgi:tRNA(Ile)-lysidine synthase
MGSRPDPLEAFTRGFQAQFRGEEWEAGSPTVLVALSGGLDSLVLLHLLRSLPGLPEMDVRAAHFDHAMRPESGEDARWVEGVCLEWDVPLDVGRAHVPPTSEDEARQLRYEFLLGIKDETGARLLLTAHHADDQAETVLFRIFRGTGLAGLAGIPRRRSPGIFRPLLPFRRSTLEEYAAVHGIRPREDPSNEDRSIPRNFLRHEVLPRVEREVAPGAMESLRRLARLARENERAWESLLPGILKGMERESDRGIVVIRSALLAYHPAVRARVLRHLLRRQGLTLSETGTRRLLECTRGGSSGRVHQLPGGHRFCREFDTFLLAVGDGPGEDIPLVISTPEAGSGEARVGGCRVEVSWGSVRNDEVESELRLDPEKLAFPLWIRGWVPGDRISLPYGGKKLKKLFREVGVPAGARGRIPVLVDARGRVLWVSGVAISTFSRTESHEADFFIGTQNVDEP